MNNLVSYKKSLNYEIDTQSLSRYDALKFILKDAIDKDKIKIGTASFTPLEDARSLIDKKFWHKFIFLGTNNLENADYIYTNHIYDIDTNINTKYQIPANFKLHKVVSKNKIRVFSIYKKISMKLFIYKSLIFSFIVYFFSSYIWLYFTIL